MSKIPVTIFSGFLGAGKTTLISDLLSKLATSRFALVVNEFGRASIDGTTLTKAGQANAIVYNITGALAGYENDASFVPTLETIAVDGTTDRLIIETSGLAVPTAIMERLNEAPLNAFFYLDAVVTVVDTPWLNEGHALQDETLKAVFANQAAAADIVVLNKIDQLNDEQLLHAEATLRDAAPSVRFVELAHHAELDPELVMGVHLHEPRHRLTAHLPAGAVAAAEGHTHSGMSAHEHGLLTHTHLHEHDPGWMSFVLHTHDRQDSRTMERAVKELCSTKPILRAKGFVLVAGGAIEVQCVRDRLSIRDCSPEHHEHHDHHAESELVFIGYELHRDEVSQRLSELTQTHWS